MYNKDCATRRATENVWQCAQTRRTRVWSFFPSADWDAGAHRVQLKISKNHGRWDAMRKLKGTILVVALALVMIPVRAAAPEVTMELKLPDKAPQTGESFTVELTMDGNPGLDAMSLTLNYDETVTECLDITTGEALSGMMSVTNPKAGNGARIAAASATGTDGDGVIARFTFRLLREAAAGLALTELSLHAGEGNIPATWTASGGDGTICIPAKQFADVKNGNTSSDQIFRGSALGLFEGYPDGSFGPAREVTRGEFATMVWRLAECPTVAKAVTWTDVPAEAFYADAAAWITDAGYMAAEAGRFAPDDAMETQEILSALYAYSGGKSGMEKMFTDIYDSAFADSGELAPEAKDGVYWAYYNELWRVEDSALRPHDGVTRAQLAELLLNYLDNFR